MAIDLGLRIMQLLDSIGIKGGSYLGKASNVRKAFTGGKPTFFKPDVLETLRATNGTFTDALNLIEEEAKFIANATDAEKMAFLNNLVEYKSLGGPQKTKGGITALDQAKNLTDEAKNLQTSTEDLMSLAKKMKDEAEANKNKALKDLDDFFTTGGQPLKAQDDKFLGGSMHEEGQLRTGIRQFLQTEYKNGRLKLNDLDKERVMQYSPMIEHDPILVFKKIYGDEAYKKAGTFPGAFEKGENFKHYEQIFRENMGDEILQVKNNEYKGDGRLVLTEQEEVLNSDPRPNDTDIPFAEGGIAGLRQGYSGGLKVSKKILNALNPKNIKKAVDNIFKTGDYKYDAEIAAESFVELNPQLFGGKLYEDLDEATRMEIYGAVLPEVRGGSKIKPYDKTTETQFNKDVEEAGGMEAFLNENPIDEKATVKKLAPQMVERLELKAKYPGITDDLLDKILADDNPQRKAEVLATIDEAFRMMEKGKGTEEIIETFKNTTRTKQASGGLAALLGEPTGYYTGGMVNVEPNLSDIGHGSDALMARTRLISPGAQGTTSTGLNYLLAEDNDNIRVPFQEGLSAAKKYGNIFVEDENIIDKGGNILEEKMSEFIPSENEKNNEMFEIAKGYQTLNENKGGSDRSLLMMRDAMFGMKENIKKQKEIFKTKVLELALKYPDKKIINDQGYVDKKELKEAIDEAEADFEISPIDGLILKRSVNTEGEQSATSGSFNINNFSFTSPNIEEGKLTSSANFDIGNLNLSGTLDTKDSNVLQSGIGFNYNNDVLKGKLSESDGFKTGELKLNKTIPINDKFNLNLTGESDMMITPDGTKYNSSDLTPKLSYNDGILSADVSKSILEGSDIPNLNVGASFPLFQKTYSGDLILNEKGEPIFDKNGIALREPDYTKDMGAITLKGSNLLSDDKGGTIGYQKTIGNPDDKFYFTLGGEKDIFDDNYTIGAGIGAKFAEGGIAGLRQGYSKGKGVDLARRGFLKVVGGTVGAIAALKSGALKLLGKGGTKAVPKIVEIGKGSGVPDWFEPMVNKVLADGIDVTKTNAVVDGQVVKRIDTPNGQVDVYHNERSGEIDVEYASESHAALGDSVHLNYKPGWSMADEGNPSPADEFLASENIPEGRQTGPDDYDIEMGENTVDEVGGLYSDTSELEKLGGQNINMREILKNIEKKKKLKKMQNEPSEFVTDVQGDYDPT